MVLLHLLSPNFRNQWTLLSSRLLLAILNAARHNKLHLNNLFLLHAVQIHLYFLFYLIRMLLFDYHSHRIMSIFLIFLGWYIVSKVFQSSRCLTSSRIASLYLFQPRFISITVSPYKSVIFNFSQNARG